MNKTFDDGRISGAGEKSIDIEKNGDYQYG